MPTGVLTEDANPSDPSITLTDVTGTWAPGLSAIADEQVNKEPPGWLPGEEFNYHPTTSEIVSYEVIDGDTTDYVGGTTDTNIGIGTPGGVTGSWDNVFNTPAVENSLTNTISPKQLILSIALLGYHTYTLPTPIEIGETIVIYAMCNAGTGFKCIFQNSSGVDLYSEELKKETNNLGAVEAQPVPGVAYTATEPVHKIKLFASAGGGAITVWGSGIPGKPKLTFTNNKVYKEDGTEIQLATIDQKFKAGDTVKGDSAAPGTPDTAAFSTTTYTGVIWTGQIIETGIDNTSKSLVWLKKQ